MTIPGFTITPYWIRRMIGLNKAENLFIDEVHKYPNWSVELKNIYDGLPEMQVIFSASSALDIYRGEADLSRRVISFYWQDCHSENFYSLLMD